MTHFASAEWPDSFGAVARMNSSISAVLFGAVGASPVTGSTEGTDLLTYTVPAGETGLYLVSAHLHVNVISDASVSQTVVAQVAYNDGVAVAAALIGANNGGGDATVSTASTLTVNFHTQQMGIIRAEAGTDIAVSTLATNGGTVATTGDIDFDVCIMRLA